MLKKLSVKSLVVFVLIAAVLFYLYQTNVGSKKSGYKSSSSMSGGVQSTKNAASVDEPNMKPSVEGSEEADYGEYAAADLSGSINLDMGCSMGAGTGLASSLMPKEVASQEDYAQFAPNDILKGQNFLDPRQQVGWPETIGGTIRNGNHDLRADPPNPKDQYTWNNSTIVPDLMQRNLFCN